MNDRNTTTCATTKAQATTQRPAYTRQVSESGVTLQVALPGVRKEDLKLTLNQSVLQLEANRTTGIADGGEAHPDHPLKVSYELGFRLDGKLDGGNVRAGLENGVLTLYIPVREEAKARNILVN